MGNCCGHKSGASRLAYNPIGGANRHQTTTNRGEYPTAAHANHHTHAVSTATNIKSGENKGHKNRAHYANDQVALTRKYDICEVLGVGSTATCHRCVSKRSGKSFACKVIDKRSIELRFTGLLEQFEVEIEVLKALNHPNIIRLEDVFDTRACIFMVTELMEGGELFDFIVEKGTLSEGEASVMVRKITSALAYMHSFNIIHRDLKPENLLLTSKRADAEVKIIDFGLSKVLHNDVAKSFLGTRGYLAPEMLQRKSYSKAVDVWSLGVIVYVLLCGCLPFDDDSSKIAAGPGTNAALNARFELRFPKWAKNLSGGAKDLLRHLLDVNSRTRYTAEQALAHPWVTGQKIKAENPLQSPRQLGRRQKSSVGTPTAPSDLKLRGSSSGRATATTQILSSSVPSMNGGYGSIMHRTAAQQGQQQPAAAQRQQQRRSQQPAPPQQQSQQPQQSPPQPQPEPPQQQSQQPQQSPPQPQPEQRPPSVKTKKRENSPEKSPEPDPIIAANESSSCDAECCDKGEAKDDSSTPILSGVEVSSSSGDPSSTPTQGGKKRNKGKRRRKKNKSSKQHP